MKKESYQTLQDEWVKLNNVKKGDRVKVEMISPSRHLGWDNSWTILMDKFVGKEAEITCIKSDGSGIELNANYDFPFFCLGVKQSQPIVIKLNDDYKAVYKIGNDYVSVGCQQIEIKVIRELLSQIDKTNK